MVATHSDQFALPNVCFQHPYQPLKKAMAQSYAEITVAEVACCCFKCSGTAANGTPLLGGLKPLMEQIISSMCACSNVLWDPIPDFPTCFALFLSLDLHQLYQETQKAY